MSLFNKSAFKNALSPYHRILIHLEPPESQPDATGFSGEEPARTDSDIEESYQQPSSGGLDAPPLVTSPDSTNAVASTPLKSAQA